MLWKTLDLVNITHLASNNSYKQNTNFISQYIILHDRWPYRGKTGAEILSINNVACAIWVQRDILPSKRKQENGSDISVFCHLQFWVHLEAEAVISGAKEDVNSDDISRPHFFCLGGGLQKNNKN